MCNFIMIMILLVTAYNGMWSRGDEQRLHMVTPRVTANTSDKLACALPPAGISAVLLVSPCWWAHVIRQQLAARSAGSNMYRPQQ